MGIKLLLADDSITIQKVVGIIFAGEDYQLAIVDNGDAALTKARETMPDVLLVDAVMPGRTGYEVCEEVRRDPSLQGVPILLLTGAFEPFDEEKARQCGADDFISKPFESQHLIDKVMSLAELGMRRKSAPPAPQPAAAPPSRVPPPVLEKPVSPSPTLAPVASPSGPPPVAERRVEQAAPASASRFAVEIVETTADDDLWGAFELEEVLEEDAAGIGEVSFAEEEASFDTEVVEEPFSFADEPEIVPLPAEFAPQWGAVEEDAFAFEEIAGDEALETVAAGDPGVFVEEDVVPFEIASEEQFGVFEEEAATVFEELPAESEEFFMEVAEPAGTEFARIETPAPLAEREFELQFAPEEEYVPVVEAIPAAAATTAASSGAVGELSLSEEQLTALVSRISRDILEKIAWEVVPDLAERIIREEIRKIRAGM